MKKYDQGRDDDRQTAPHSNMSRGLVVQDPGIRFISKIRISAFQKRWFCVNRGPSFLLSPWERERPRTCRALHPPESEAYRLSALVHRCCVRHSNISPWPCTSTTTCDRRRLVLKIRKTALHALGAATNSKCSTSSESWTTRTRRPHQRGRTCRT